jgi:hypothetical protein
MPCHPKPPASSGALHFSRSASSLASAGRLSGKLGAQAGATLLALVWTLGMGGSRVGPILVALSRTWRIK